MVKSDSEWHVIYTRTGSETRVSQSLGKKKIAYYCPFTQVQSRPGLENKIFIEPLFKSQVFIKISKNQLADVKRIRDVINFLYWLNKPVVVKEHEIEKIKEFLHERVNVQLEKIPVTANANSITVENIIGGQGNLSGVSKKSARLTLPSLGYAMISDEFKTLVEEAPAFKTKYRPFEKLLMRVQLNYYRSL